MKLKLKQMQIRGFYMRLPPGNSILSMINTLKITRKSMTTRTIWLYQLRKVIRTKKRERASSANHKETLQIQERNQLKLFLRIISIDHLSTKRLQRTVILIITIGFQQRLRKIFMKSETVISALKSNFFLIILNSFN